MFQANEGFVGSPWSAEQVFVVIGPCLSPHWLRATCFVVRHRSTAALCRAAHRRWCGSSGGVNGNLGSTTSARDCSRCRFSKRRPDCNRSRRIPSGSVASNSAGLVVGTNQSFTTALPAPVVSTLAASNVLWTSAGLLLLAAGQFGGGLFHRVGRDAGLRQSRARRDPGCRAAFRWRG